MRGCRQVAAWCCLLLGGAWGVLDSHAATFEENFSVHPQQRGWQVFGETNLFAWDIAGQELRVTWDSSRSNSFFYHSLGTILSGRDDFSVSFDIRLQDIRAGSTPGKTNEFEIAVGLIQYASATNANAFRGAGQSPLYGVRNLVEFDYFPDTGFGDTFATTVVSTNNRIFPVHSFPLTMSTGDTFHILMTNNAQGQRLSTRATKNGLPWGMPPDNSLPDLFLADTPDFRVDSFAIINYSDAIQAAPPAFQGSVLAHGVIDNVKWVVPALPAIQFRLFWADSGWHAEFPSRTNWLYTLERSAALKTWSGTSAPAPGTGETLRLSDHSGPAGTMFYRVRAERP